MWDKVVVVVGKVNTTLRFVTGVVFTAVFSGIEDNDVGRKLSDFLWC